MDVPCKWAPSYFVRMAAIFTKQYSLRRTDAHLDRLPCTMKTNYEMCPPARRQVPRIADSLRPCFRISYEQRPRLATLAAHVTWSSMDVAVKLEDVHPSSSTSLIDKPIFEVW